MKKFNRILWPGLLALFLSGTAGAQVYVANPGYPASATSGSATVWGNSMGSYGVSGTINVSNGYGYGYAGVPVAMPVAVPVAAYTVAPAYYGVPVYAHPRPYYRGRGHGHRHKHHRGYGMGHR